MKKTLIIANPYEGIIPEEESTVVLAAYAQKLGMECHWCIPNDIYLRNSALFCHARKLAKGGFSIQPSYKLFKFTDFHSIHWRYDPPVDLKTMRLWTLLAPFDLPVYNSLRGLLMWNEKFSTLRYGKEAIATSTAEKKEELKTALEFYKKKNKSVILKSSGNSTSRDVQVFGPESTEKENLDFLAPLGPWPIVQNFKKEIFKGEERAFAVDGKIIMVARKIPKPINGKVDPVMRWFKDTSLEPTVVEVQLPKSTMKIAQEVAKDLKKDGVLFANVDFVGGQLLEINVTSPGMLVYISKESQDAICSAYWKAVLRK